MTKKIVKPNAKSDTAPKTSVPALVNVVTVRPVGRPSSYSDEIAATICERIALGESLRAICHGDDMPSESMTYRWLASNHDFREQYSLARQIQADTKFDRVGDVAEDALRGVVDPLAARVFIDATKWQASRLAPKKYGDKIEIDRPGQIAVDAAVALARRLYGTPVPV
jgi:hypothetical protein